MGSLGDDDDSRMASSDIDGLVASDSGSDSGKRLGSDGSPDKGLIGSSCSSESGIGLDLASDGYVSASDGEGLLPEKAVASGADMAEGNWKPGENLGRWSSRMSPGFSEDAQMMFANLCLQCRRIPAKLRSKVLILLEPTTAECTRTSLWTLVGAFVRLSRATVHKWFKAIESRGWDPKSLRPSRRGSTRDVSVQTGEGDELATLCRYSLSSASEGRSLLSFERDVVRCALAHGAVGDKGYTRGFAREAQHVGATLQRLLDAQDINRVLPGLGIPSDFAIMFDPVSLGKGMFTRHGTVLMTAISLISPSTGDFYLPMLDAPGMGLESHTGEAQKDSVITVCSKHPAGLTPRVLQSRVSVIGGDEQIVSGGPAHRHSSSRAAELLWSELHPGASCEDGAEIISCVRWDDFHRCDLAAMRAVRQCGMAKEVFDMSAILDSQFGVNEGRMFFHAIAELTGDSPKAVQGSGGTRKIVYYSGVVRNMIANYKIYIAGMHGRLAWKQSGHGKQPLHMLTSMGLRLQSISFVTFLCIFADILEQVVNPYAKVVQGAVHPAVVHESETKMLSAIDRAIKYVELWQERLCVMVLCAQHMHIATWSPYLLVWRQEASGRAFPTFLRHLVDMFRSPPMFQGTPLQTPPGRQGWTCYGPHCQCVTRVNQGKKSRVRCDLGKGQAKQKIKVPRWVKGTRAQQGVKNPRKDDHWLSPRVQWRQTGLQLPGDVRGPGFFRVRISNGNLREACGHSFGDWRGFRFWKGLCLCKWSSRCHVPESHYTTQKEMSAGLNAAKHFLTCLRKEMVDIFGDVGVNKGMRDLTRLASVCWNWKQLIHDRPGPQHIQAFLGVARFLKPFLQHTITPDPNQYPGVDQVKWDEDDATLAQNYQLLTMRVRAAAGFERLKKRQAPPPDVLSHASSWYTVVSYEVKPVYAFPIVLKLFTSLVDPSSWPPTSLHSMTCSACCVVSQFMGKHDERPLARAAWSTFSVPCKELFPVGRARRRVFEKKSITHAVGSICVVRRGCPGRRYLVLVISHNMEVQVQTISAALDLFSWFSNGGVRGGGSTWFANRHHHRCRVLFPVEAVCERLGSLAHNLFDAGGIGQHLSPGPLIDRLFLCQAHVVCCGNERDEWLVRETANVLQQVFKKSATLAARRRKQTLQQATGIQKQTLALESSGRTHHNIEITWQDWVAHVAPDKHVETSAKSLRQEAWREYLPLNLPAAVAQSVGAIQKPNGELARALPIDVLDLHHRQRNWADSSNNSYLKTWLESDDGKHWLVQRATLLQCDDPHKDEVS